MFSSISLADNSDYSVSDGGCEALLHRTARMSHTQTFSRVWLKELNRPAPARIVVVFFFCVSFQKKSHLHSPQVLNDAQSLLPDFPFPPPQHAPSLYIPRTVLNPAIHAMEASLVDWSNNVLSQVNEPNVTLELSSTEVTLVLLPSRRSSFVSAYNTGEDVTTALVSPEVDERPKHGHVGFTAVYAEERGKCSTSKNLSL